MLKAVEMEKDIYWVGAIDWSMRTFHGYSTRRGSSYNAYLILDDKITLIDTVKAPFANELLERVSSVVDPSQIDYIVSNHVEPDHSGALPFIAAHCPHAEIVTSTPNGLKGLAARYGSRQGIETPNGTIPFRSVKTGDTLLLGHRTLSFVATPMLHWPDSMVTYCPEDNILFSNDAFGQHLATGQRFDDENDLAVVLAEAQKYYANILMLYGKQAQTALQALDAIPIRMILTGHGVSWRTRVHDILASYRTWSAGALDDKAVVVFDSMWGSTEILAHTITDAFIEKGLPVQLFDLRVDHISDIMTAILNAKYLAVGSPTLNNQMMPHVAGFLCYLKGFVPKGRRAFAFGSFGWSGQSIGLVEEGLKAAGCDICMEKAAVRDIPAPETLAALRESVLAIG